MSIEDVFTISGRGTVATGRIERGVAKVGDLVDIVGIMKTRQTTITGIEMFQKTLDLAEAGDNVGILLRGLQKTEVLSGMILSKPSTIKAYEKFEAEEYILKKEERSEEQTSELKSLIRISYAVF